MGDKQLSSIQAIIKKLTIKLTSPLISEHLAYQEAWWMLESLTGASKAELCALSNISLSVDQQSKLDDWVLQRVFHNKPLQYILGTVPFCELTILVRPPILIPRPETEEWVTWLIALIAQQKGRRIRILDLCTGTGCIGLALARHVPELCVVGVDINPEAVALAYENKRLNAISNIEFIISDLFDDLKNEKFDIIVTNPPYLSQQEYEHIHDDVKKWEDKRALVTPADGMELYNRIITKALNCIDVVSHRTNFKNLPVLVGEIGPAQKEVIVSILAQNNFKNIELFSDLQGVLRWFIASI